MKILVFLQGTAIMHASGAGCSREERVRQVQQRDPSVREHADYIPVGDAAEKLRAWAAQGAEILFLSSHRDPAHMDEDMRVLRRYGFPEGTVLFRRAGEAYHDVAERALPDVLIEDDCESIGGAAEMVYPHMRPEMRSRITSIVVREFEGLDHLPERAVDLIDLRCLNKQ
jgi:hypothetical protein